MERVVGQYRILEEIGQGGSGTVFRAWHTSLKRAVALKLPAPAEKNDAGARAAFLERARAAAALRHPHIVGIVEVFDDEDGYGYSMECLDGPSLDELLAGGALDPARALEIFKQVCRGVRAAHEAGIVHGDIKPANILFDRDLTGAKVSDFGAARRFRVEDGEITKEHDRRILGTLNYMAPEVREGKASPDPRADVYSLGVLLYRMLTGNLPLGSFRLPSHCRRMIPAALDRVVLRCLRSDPRGRYGDVRELLADLGGERRRFFSLSRLPRRWRVLVSWTGGAVFLAAAAGAVYYLVRPSLQAGLPGAEYAFAPSDLKTAFARAALLEREGKGPEAARELERLARAHPGSPLSDHALFRAGGLREKEGEYAAAAADYRELVETNGASKLAAAAVLRRAVVLSEQLGEEEQAVLLLRRVRDSWPASAEAPEALLRIGLLKEGSEGGFFESIFGSDRKAVLQAAAAALEELVRVYPHSSQAVTGARALARIYGREGLDDPAAARKWASWSP